MQKERHFPVLPSKHGKHACLLKASFAKHKLFLCLFRVLTTQIPEWLGVFAESFVGFSSDVLCYLIDDAYKLESSGVKRLKMKPNLGLCDWEFTSDLSSSVWLTVMPKCSSFTII
jgi:hypothetical protein